MCLSLMEEKWDIAIILDACRYDVFREVYEEYLPRGKLEQRIGASDTFEWLHSVFNGNRTKDMLYVSAHPGINGRGVPWGSFDAKEQFYKVYDAWLKGWNWEIGTSIPNKVAEIAIQAVKEFPDKKTIIHFIQPHFPYRKAPCPSKYSDLNSAKKDKKVGILLERLIRRLISLFEINLSRFRSIYWNIKKTLQLDFLEDLNEIYWREYTIEELKYFHKDNLEWVLESVEEIVDEFDKAKIVITSDHGEAFGEDGEFFHTYKTTNPVVRLVPFWHNA